MNTDTNETTPETHSDSSVDLNAGATARRGSLVDWLGYVALRCIVCLIQTVSLETCDRICKLLAYAIANWTTLRRKVTDDNLKLVYGDLPAAKIADLRERMWHNLLLMVCEIAHAPRKIHRTNWHQHFQMPFRRHVLSMALDSRACVLVTGHFGNFEIAGYAVGKFGMPISSMARPLDNPYVDDYVKEFRAEGGQEILPKEDSAHLVQELLEQGGTLGLLADQHAGGKGVWVEFFHHATSCHKALALFVLSSKAPMAVHYNRRLDRPLKFDMGLTGIVDPDELESDNPPKHLQSVLELTEWYNDCLEEAIRKSPEQYWWLHRRWREVPEKQQRRIEKRRLKKLAEREQAEKLVASITEESQTVPETIAPTVCPPTPHSLPHRKRAS